MSTPSTPTVARSDVLEPAFVAGWRSLPDELKVEILKQVLTKSYIFDKSLFHIRDIEHWKESGLALLYGTKEFSGLAKEVIYSCNTFSIRREKPHTLQPSVVCYPRLRVNHFIRRLHVYVTPTMQDWKFLSKLAKGGLGFNNLQVVKVEFDASSVTNSRTNLERLATLMSSEVITFRVRRLEVLCLHAYNYPWSRLVDTERTKICRNDIEPLLPDCLVTNLPDVERGPNKMVEEKRTRISNTTVQCKETRIVLSY